MNCIICDQKTSTSITNELRAGEKVPVLYCANCDLGMLDGNVDTSKDYYREEYRQKASPVLGTIQDAEGLFNTAVDFQEDRIRLLKEHLGKDKRLLEVGCSAGMFLWHAKDLVKEVVGIDYDASSAAHAAKKCSCKVYDRDIEETDLAEGSFDIICAFQTLEHVADPIAFISKYAKYLKQDGVMAIEVPNLHDALVYAYNLPNHAKFFYHVSHPWYFTEKSLLKVMEKAGLQGKVTHIQDYNILNHMNWILNDKPQPSNLAGLSKPALPLRDNAPEDIKKALSDFMVDMDSAYKQKLAGLKITSNIFFIGKNI